MTRSPRRERIDVLLVEQGLAPSRTRAQALVLAGEVFIGTQRVDKPGNVVERSSLITVKHKNPFVSRGGNKLQGALDTLHIDVEGHICVDIGASTGGFTDCLLQRGAIKVYAVDVGQAQLAEKLRQDPRVVVRERTNARHLEREHFAEPIDLIVVDASFIGIGKLLPAITRVLPQGGQLLAMIKPQFEAGRELARATRGVIRDESTRAQVLEGALAEIRAQGYKSLGECDSSLRGPKGNLEYFVWATREQP